MLLGLCLGFDPWGLEPAHAITRDRGAGLSGPAAATKEQSHGEHLGKGSACPVRSAPTDVAGVARAARAGQPDSVSDMVSTGSERQPATTPLDPAPSRAVSADGIPRFGGYAGLVARTGMAALADSHRLGGTDPFGMARRKVREKSWVYLFAATDEIAVTSALVNGGITGSGFLMVTGLQTGAVIADSSRKGALAAVNDAPGDGLRATYRLPGTRYTVCRDGDEIRFQASLGRSMASVPGRSHEWVELDLTLREGGLGITAVSEVDHGQESSVSVTGKTAGLAASGSVVVHGEKGSRTVSLDGGLGGYDYTKGMLCRSTAWRWAYGTGRLEDGTVLGLNLTEGFSGVGERSRENVVWIDGRPIPLDPRSRFTFDRTDLMAPWHVATADGSLRLRFEPLALHHEHLDVKVLRSHFVQPVGHFSGEIDVAGRTYTLDRLPGVAEDQDIVW